MMNQKASDINQVWANMMVEELRRHGIEQFVLSPGSRCSPLTIAAARSKTARVTTHFDERGAAFFALGEAGATGRPSVLVCTSGTATANYYPAVVEASMDMIPMIILTADRPSYLRNTGANQTIDQVELYGRYVRFFHDLPCPDEKSSPKSLLTVLDEAVRLATRTPRGPVQINCQFDEPLAPTDPERDFGDYLSGVENWLKGSQPYLSVEREKNPDPDNIEAAVSSINGAEFGILVVGKLETDDDIQAAKDLAEQLNWPVVADIRSGLRLGPACRNLMAYFDQLLLSESYQSMRVPVIVHLGGVVASKRLNQYFKQRQCEHHIHVVDHPFRLDPNDAVTERIEGGIAGFCRAMTTRISSKSDSGKLDELRRANDKAGETIDRFGEDHEGLTEFAVSRIVSTNVRAGEGLFLGSSMPIRDMDMYGEPSGPTVRVIANRGASGIDGSIATAAGYAAGSGETVTAIIGDLAMLHDLNSLALLRGSTTPVILIVINNNGGGIFSFLPVAGCRDVFETYFGTPHGLSFEKTASMFGLGYFRPDSKQSFVDMLRQAQASEKSSIIEVVTDREKNHAAHLKLQDEIKGAIES
ncbi:MAG: 2-succinyl-5-enolpyruvyl-6-hydroxy-3-cyclohexene-1-carboxylic-acid synthase [Candidatus Zixiibacteriota bacterium]|nr:MAG: 2-succinyl-5-enolpyruvyl-6-hydroxy-3-cyclohexene-1-carboxylic-acid synthase [candidate division Zixibacteria bacterium]